MNTLRLIKLLSVVFLALVISGCKDDPVHDPVLDRLERFKERAKDQSAYKQRLEMAISQWQNKSVDRKPILLNSGLGDSLEMGESITLLMFDEDLDIIGFGVKEIFTDTNGSQTVLNEEYPVFVHTKWPEKLAAPVSFLPVQIRNDNQRKDEQKWKKYINGEGIDVNKVQDIKYWRQTLPTAWVSIPDPNNVDVDVYIYDKAGHKSEPIKLLSSDDISNE